MNSESHVVCQRCGRGMQPVAEIASAAAGPGLVAFFCIDCGTTESTLAYPVSRSATPRPLHWPR
jgi:hypothetical protein